MVDNKKLFLVSEEEVTEYPQRFFTNKIVKKKEISPSLEAQIINETVGKAILNDYEKRLCISWIKEVFQKLREVKA